MLWFLLNYCHNDNKMCFFNIQFLLREYSQNKHHKVLVNKFGYIYNGTTSINPRGNESIFKHHILE